MHNARSRLTTVLVTALWTAMGIGGPGTAHAQPSPLTDSARFAAWSDDLTTLVAHLERRHPNPYFRRSRDGFHQEVGEIRAAIRSSDDVQLALRVQRLVASIGDGHTSVALDLSALGFRRVPISPYVFDDGVYIRDADSSASAAIGARILGIGALPIDTVLARLRPFLAAETEAWVLQGLPNQLVLAQVLREIGAASGVDSVALHLLLRDGQERTVHVATVPVAAPVQWSLQGSVPLESLPLFRRWSGRNYWFEYLAAERTMYVGYNRAANDAAHPLDAFGAQLQDALRGADVQRIVVDFRLNSGGNSALFGAIERPIRAYTRAHPSVRLVGVIGRRTFSSGLMNAIAFQRASGAMLVGEMAGGRPNHFGEVRQFTLPHFGIRVSHSTRAWRLVRNADPPALLPDLAVPVLASDHFALRDAVLERILQLPR